MVGFEYLKSLLDGLFLRTESEGFAEHERVHVREEPEHEREHVGQLVLAGGIHGAKQGADIAQQNRPNLILQFTAIHSSTHPANNPVKAK